MTADLLSEARKVAEEIGRSLGMTYERCNACGKDIGQYLPSMEGCEGAGSGLTVEVKLEAIEQALPILLAFAERVRRERDFEWWEAVVLVDNVEPTPEGGKHWVTVMNDYCYQQGLAESAAEVARLKTVAEELRSAQRAYMANRGNDEYGRAVAVAAERLDFVLKELKRER